MLGYVNKGKGWRAAASLDVLTAEVERRFPRVYCVGVLGNAEHAAQGGFSDHNPIVQKDGVGVVRAVDYAGPQDDLTAIEMQINRLYNAKDVRVYRYGYTHMNDRTTVWDDDPATTLHPDPGDVGHLHVSLTSTSYPTVPGGYLPGIDSKLSWGIFPPPAKPKVEDEMANTIVCIVDNKSMPAGVTWPGVFVLFPNSNRYVHVAKPNDQTALSKISDVISISYDQHVGFVQMAGK